MSWSRSLLVAVIVLLARSVAAQNGTTIGTYTLVPTFDNIGVKLTYTGDANSNNAATLQYRVNGSSAWLNGHTASYSSVAHWPDRRATSNGLSNTANQKQFRASLVGLRQGVTYEVQVVVSDADGITGTATQTTTVTLLDPSTLVTQSGTTKYLDTAAAGGGDGSLSTPYNTWANAQTGTSCGDTLFIKANSTVTGVTFSKSCSASTWYVIHCANKANVVFAEGTGTTPNLTISGDYVKVYNCRFTASSDDNISLASSPTNIWLDNLVLVDVLTAAASAECGTSRLYEGSIEIAAGASNITITNNSINQLGTHAPCVSDHSNSSGRAIMFNGASTGGRHIIKGNTIAGKWSDCIGNSPENETNIFDNSDILNNLFTSGSCSDDAIQLEGSDINVRIGGNAVIASSIGASCIATQAAFFGPTYLYRNTCDYAGPNNAYKLGGSESDIWFHNTAKNSQTGGVYCWGDSGEGNQQYVLAVNNICQTNQSSVLNLVASNSTFDYNVEYTAGGTPVVETWNGTTNYNSLALFCSGAGQECHGQSGNPLLDASLRIDNTSPAYNHGVAIANFNDDTSPWPAVGTPDIGFYEVVSRAASLVAVPPCTGVVAVAVRGATNPAMSGQSLRVSGCVFGDITGTLELCDAATYAVSATCTTQAVSAWTSTTITGTTSIGNVPYGTTAYLYVTPSGGSAQTAGFPVPLLWTAY